MLYSRLQRDKLTPNCFDKILFIGWEHVGAQWPDWHVSLSSVNACIRNINYIIKVKQCFYFNIIIIIIVIDVTSIWSKGHLAAVLYKQLSDSHCLAPHVLRNSLVFLFCSSHNPVCVKLLNCTSLLYFYKQWESFPSSLSFCTFR